MFKFFESLVDPYLPYAENDTPPTKLWPFLREYLKPFRAVVAVTFTFSTVVAFGEILLIWYVARIVDLLAQGTPEMIIPEYGLEFALVAFWVLVLRTLIGFVDVALLHNTLLPNLARLSAGGRTGMCCANRLDGSKTILPAVSPTGSCKRRQPRARPCFKCSMQGRSLQLQLLAQSSF